MTSSQSAVVELQHLLTIPPNNLDAQHRNNPIAVAHAALQSLRDSGDEKFLFLRTIIELSAQFTKDQEELLFHCITGLRQVILWHWKQYSPQFLRGLRDCLMILGHGINQSRTVRLACYTTTVSFWKRGWNEAFRPQAQQQTTADELHLLQAMTSAQTPDLMTKQDLFHYLDSLFVPSQNHLYQASVFVNCLVSEFAGKSAVSYRLPLEFHKECHRSFEKDGALNQCLKLSMGALSYIVSAASQHPDQMDAHVTTSVVQLTSDCIGWEFGSAAWDTGNAGLASTARTLLRPPVEWREFLVRPDFIAAIFGVHKVVVASQQSELGHYLRQLLLQLASLSGPLFQDANERKQFASYLLDGTLELLQTTSSSTNTEPPELLDTLQLISRIISNFRLSILVELPSLMNLLQGLTVTGNKLLAEQLKECEEAKGDLDAMGHREWREEALSLLLDCAVSLAGDPWLLYSGNEETRKNAQHHLSAILGPLYEGFIHCRTRMAAMEEYHAVSSEADLDEAREEIEGLDLEEEISSVSTIGRLNLSSAISCLSAAFGHTVPRLQSLWEGSRGVAPEAAALLEESRLLILYVCQLLTDNNEGESPAIPDAVLVACQDAEGLAANIASAVQALLKFADAQVHKIAENPSNPRLSPLLAKAFLWFSNRWAPAYIYPVDYGSSNAANKIVMEWSTTEKAQQATTFCLSLCLYYQCYWPHERQVQESASQLLLSLAKRDGQIRSLMVASPMLHQMVRFHCLTAGLRHSASREELDAAVRARVGSHAAPSSMDMVWGYQRLPYTDKARVLTAIIVTCSDSKNETANRLIGESLKVILDAFTAVVNNLASKQVAADDVNAKEMACLCVEMFCGVARASEMSESERIPQFITPYLSQLSGLMNYYASDLTICETLLRFFRDYTEQFVAMLDKDQSVALFNASAELLKSYSANHCAARVIEKKKSAAEAEAEEEQSYSDILCAIQLLINLGTKDFIDACNSQEGMESTQVTDVIFFGLQQILPLMSQGLLQYPTLCTQFFDLVAFMMDTYPEKVCVLPYELFDSLLESLLFGMSHVDPVVAKCSLYGIASIAREHLKTQILAPHLTQHPDIVDKCTRRLLTEVVFQTVVVDRVEAAGAALLPLAAIDVNRFAAIVQDLANQVPDANQRARLNTAFTKLIQPEVLANVSKDGYEGRMNRMRFRESFQEFVNEIHSFLILR